MYRVELKHWNESSGFYSSETFDNIEKLLTAEEYYKTYDGDLTPEDPSEAVNIEIYDTDDELLSDYWLQK